jgi:hypothetical protein
MQLPESGAELAVYLINLDRAPDRLARMAARLQAAGVAFERVAAVDGRALQFPIPEFSALSYKFLHGRRTVPSEIGCYLSHIACARRLLQGQASHALILEDDADLPEDMIALLDAAALALPYSSALSALARAYAATYAGRALCVAARARVWPLKTRRRPAIRACLFALPARRAPNRRAADLAHAA